MRVTKAIRKYLAGYAEPEGELASALDTQVAGVAHALVIPSYGEGAGVLGVLESIPRGPRGPVLSVLVVNEPPDAPDAMAEANRETLRAVETRYGPPVVGDNAALVFRHDRGPLVVITRTGARAIPEEQGVGLARKIGFDVALAVAHRQERGVPLLHGTDADAVLPPDYFEAAERAGDCAALLYPFRHVAGRSGVGDRRSDGDPADADTASDPNHPVFAYEAYLRYYVLGLRYAGSRYAFHTIGSTVSVTPHAYAAVRGVPKRNGAEDFYLLNKLVQIGDIAHARSSSICLSARASTRVPFGTGPAIARARALSDPWLYPVHDPRAFDALRSTLRNGGELDALQTLKLIRSEDTECPLREASARAPFVPFEDAPSLSALCDQLAEAENEPRHLSSGFSAEAG